MIATIALVVLVIRVLSLVIYVGVLLFYIVAIFPGTRKLPPTHRAAILFPLVRKTALFSFVISIVLGISGLAYAEIFGLLKFSLDSDIMGSLLVSEMVVNGLLIIVATAIVFILFVAKSSAPTTSIIASAVDDAKWLTFNGANEFLKRSNKVNLLYTVNLLCGLTLIVLGVLIQKG